MKNKTAKRFLSAALAASMLASAVPCVYAENDDASDAELIAELQSYSDDYPNGGFAFRESQLEAYEDDGSLYVDVVRMGSFEGDAEVTVKAVDVSAVYGKDYTLSVEENKFLTKVLEQDEDAVPIMDLYADMTEDTEIGATEPEEAEETENVIDMVIDAENGIVSADSSNDADGSDASEDISDTPSGGLKKAREIYTGEQSDRKDWQEITGDETGEAAELADEMSDNNGYIGEFAEGLPGTEYTLEFADSEYMKRIKVNLVDDDLSETDEQVIFMLCDEQGAEMAKPSTAYLNILDSDENEPVVFSMAEDKITVTPDEEYATVTVKRDSGVEKFASVTVGTGAIDAEPDKDYKSGSVEVIFPQGVTEKNVKVPIYNTQRTDAVSFVVAIDTESANADEETRATVVTILPDYSVQSAELYSEKLSETEMNAQSVDIYVPENEDADDTVSLMGNKPTTDTYTFENTTFSSPNSGTGYNTYTILKELDLRNATSVTITYSSSGSYDNIYTTGSGCNAENHTDTKHGRRAMFTVGGTSATVSTSDKEDENKKTVTVSGFNNAPNQTITLSVCRTDNASEKGSVSYTVNNILITYSNITVAVDTTDYAGINTYTEKIYQAGGSNYDKSLGLYYNEGNTLKLGTASVNGTTSASFAKFSSAITLSASSPPKSSVTTSQGVAAEIGKNVYLAGWQVYNESTNDYYSEIVPPDNMNLEKMYNIAGNQSSYQVRPVFYPYSSMIRFNNSYCSKLAYTNNIGYGADIGVTMLDTLIVEGVSVENSGYAVEAFQLNGYSDSSMHLPTQTNANTRAKNANDFKTKTSNSKQRTSYLDSNKSGGTSVTNKTNSADTSRITIMPNCEAIYLGMTHTQPQITVQYNPLAPTAYKDEGSVFYWDTTDGTNNVIGNYDTPMVIQPVTFGKLFQINAIYSDSDTNQISDYKTIWQDFTGDSNGDGLLDQDEQEPLSQYELDRDAATGDVFTYQPKVTNSQIYYYFDKRLPAPFAGCIYGIVAIRDYPVFGDGTATITPINDAWVSVDGITTTTAYDKYYGGLEGKGGDGYFNIADKAFVSGEAHMVNIDYGSLSTAAVQNVNISQTYILDAYDTISVNTAKKSKNGSEMKSSDAMLNDDANYTLTFNTTSSLSALVAEKATLKFYRRDGSYITEQEYSSTGTKTGVFECTFNPKTLSLPAGTTITVTFTDNEGTTYFEHDTGLTLMQSLGAISLLSSFAGGAAPALQVIGTVSSAFNFGWDGNLDDRSAEIGDDGKYGNYSITTTTESKVLNLSLKFSKEGDNDDKKKSKSEVKEAAESTDASQKSEAAKSADSGENETKSKLAVGYSVKLSFGLTLTLNASTDADHKGEWYFEEFMLVVNAAGEVNASKSFVTPIGIPVIVGGKIGATGCAIVVVERRLGRAEYYLADLTSGSNGSVDLINAGQKYSDDMYVYGDFTIAPYIGLSAGIGSDSFNIQLEGDADFSFNFNTKTKENTGNVKFTCKLNIKVLFFSKSWNLGSTEVSLFSEKETLYEGLGTFEVSQREYLDDRSEWTGDGGVSLYSVANLNEITLRTGVNPNADTKLMPIGDGKYIAVFVDDVPERTAENSMAVYYTVYNGTQWSEPQIIEDDGTNDDSPAIYDLGNGKLFIAWSSANDEFETDPSMLNVLNARNIRGAFFDKSALTMSNVIEITKDTYEDYCADNDVQIAYDSATGRMLIYYTKSEYEASDNDEGVYGDAVYPYSVIAYRIYDTASNEFIGYSAEEEADIKADLKKAGVTDDNIDAAYDEYVTNWYGQRILALAPTVIVSETLDESGYWTEEPTISEYAGENDPLVVESDAISYNGLSLLAYVLDYDGDKSTTNDRDVFLQIYNFEENSVTYSIMITSNDTAEGNLHFERIGGENGITYLSYLSGGEIKMFDISDNISNSNVTAEAVTDDGTPYYYLRKTRDAGYIPEVGLAGADADGDYTGELEITDFDLRSNKDYFYVMFTERATKLKDGVEPNTEAAALAENNIVETQIYMMRYDIANGLFTSPVQVTEDAGANYANVAFAVADSGFIAMATRSESTTEMYEGALISTANTENSSLRAITFTPDASVEARNAAIDDITAGANIYSSIEVYNGGIETIDGVTVSVTDSNGNTLTPFYGYDTDGETELTSVSLIGGQYKTVSFTVPVAEDEASASFTAVVKDKDGNELDTISLTKEAQRKADVASFNAEITDRGVISFNANAVNNEQVASGDDTFTISAGDKIIYSDDIASIAPGDEVTIYGSFEVDYDELFDSVTNDDGSVTADTVLTASISGETSESTVSLYASTDQMARMNAVKSVTFATKSSVQVAEGEFVDLAPEITVGEYNGRFEDNNEEEIGAQGVEFTYLSDNEDVAKVYTNGYIEGVSEGSATITALLMPMRNTYSDGDYQDNYPTMPDEAIKVYTFDVEVTAAAEPTPTPTTKSSGGSSGGTSSYKVTFDAGKHGEITSGKDSVSVAYNKKIASANVPTVAANEGYVFLGWSADGETVTDVTTIAIKKATTFTALYEATGTTEPQETAEPQETTKPSDDGYVNPFADVFESDWFYDSVKYVYENNMFTGVEADKFDPQGNLTRAMLVTVLYRSENEPESTESSGFEDVEAGSWYENAVAWAENNGIVKGYSDTEFAPNDSITREQIAAIMFRFAQYKGTAPEGDWAIQLDYADLADISDYASEAVMYCKLKGIMLGNEKNEFKPSDNATRAEAAAIMQRFTEDLKTINE